MTKKLSMHIVNYEAGWNDGILSKFANKLVEELKKVKGVKVSISNRPRRDVDINHHINYAPYTKNSDTKNTLMVTHIWKGEKLDKLKKGMESADMGICMSDDTKKQLIKWGLPKKIHHSLARTRPNSSKASNCSHSYQCLSRWM